MPLVHGTEAQANASPDYDPDTLRKIFCSRVDGTPYTEVYNGKYRNWVFISTGTPTMDMPLSARRHIQYCDWYVDALEDGGTYRLFGFCKTSNPKKQHTVQSYFFNKVDIMPCELFRLKTSGYLPFQHEHHFFYGLSTISKYYRPLVEGNLEDDIQFNLNPVNRFFGFIRSISKTGLEACRIIAQVPSLLDDPLPDPRHDFSLPHFTAYAKGLKLSSSSPPLSPEPSTFPPDITIPPKKRFYSVEIRKLEDLYRSDDETDVYSSPDAEDKFQNIVDNICVCNSRKERNKIIKLG